SYPTDFGRAWKSVLFNQFHDILAGTSLEAAYEDARNGFGEAITIADRNLNNAVQSFAWNIQIEPEDGMKPVIVFNPHPRPVHANIELESYRWPDTAVLVDENEQPTPHQAVQSTSVTGRVRLSFNADLPALGYRTFRLRAQGTAAEKPPVYEASDTVLENARFRLEFDPETGCIARLYDKQAQVEVFSGQAAVPVVIKDESDTWSHNVYIFDEVIGRFTPVSLKRIEDGPVKSVIRVTSEYGQSTLIQDFTMYPESDQIDVRVTVDWRDQLKMLKLRFPVNIKFMKVTHEIAYGHIEQFASGEEAPSQGWIDISGTAREQDILYGFSLLNDGKYSQDVNLNDIGLTVLRSPVYAHHDPHKLDPDKHYRVTDQGIQQFSYALLPHTGSWETAGTVQHAALLNQPPIPQFATFHPDGKLPQSDSFMHVQPDNVIVTVLKQAEDGDAVIIRAYETTKTATQATIQLPKWNRTIEATFAPCEIKTFCVPKDAAQPVVETDLLEWAE
ncbi:MAG: alpha-mannosidase, partial [Anaerolineae bacterium]|nr:alpha-mannosidase [Anaerolineae bacterium]